jgi:transcriptional regulator of arginine metabolism
MVAKQDLLAGMTVRRQALDMPALPDNMRIIVFICAFNRMPAESESRQKRQEAILEILRQRPVARQTQLVALLRDKGIEATQSSVSRDLRQLGVTKLDQGYAQAEPLHNESERSIPGDFVRDVQTAGVNLTIVKTAVGAAQRVAVYLDRSDWSEIVGTLSGDDTIFVATRNGAEQRRLVAKLRAQFEE